MGPVFHLTHHRLKAVSHQQLAHHMRATGWKVATCCVVGQVSGPLHIHKCATLQMAEIVGDDRLISEAAMHLYNCLAPLMALPTKSASLLKALTACHLTLTSVQQKPIFTIQVCT